jgi:hypothetical protein
MTRYHPRKGMEMQEWEPALVWLDKCKLYFQLAIGQSHDLTDKGSPPFADWFLFWWEI